MLRQLKIVIDGVLASILLATLGGICLVFSIGALLVHPLLPRRAGAVAGRWGIMGGFRLFSWLLCATGAYRLDLRALDSLRSGPPVILAPNHPSLIDAMLILSRHPDLACVMKAELGGNLFLGAGARLAGYIPGHNARQMVREAVAELRCGSSLLLFPEGTRTTCEPINGLTAGVAVIARHAQVPIQIAIIETSSPYLGKGWPLWRPPSLPIVHRIRLGRRLDPSASVDELMAALEREYRQQLQGSLQSGWLPEASGSRVDGFSP